MFQTPLQALLARLSLISAHGIQFRASALAIHSKLVSIVGGLVTVAKVESFLKSPVGHTRGEAIAMTAATGVGVGMTNSVINRHYIDKGKNTYRAHKLRRLEGKHGLQRKGGVN